MVLTFRVCLCVGDICGDGSCQPATLPSFHVCLCIWLPWTADGSPVSCDNGAMCGSHCGPLCHGWLIMFLCPLAYSLCPTPPCFLPVGTRWTGSPVWSVRWGRSALAAPQSSGSSRPPRWSWAQPTTPSPCDVLPSCFFLRCCGAIFLCCVDSLVATFCAVVKCFPPLIDPFVWMDALHLLFGLWLVAQEGWVMCFEVECVVGPRVAWARECLFRPPLQNFFGRPPPGPLAVHVG